MLFLGGKTVKYTVKISSVSILSLEGCVPPRPALFVCYRSIITQVLLATQLSWIDITIGYN